MKDVRLLKKLLTCLLSLCLFVQVLPSFTMAFAEDNENQASLEPTAIPEVLEPTTTPEITENPEVMLEPTATPEITLEPEATIEPPVSLESNEMSEWTAEKGYYEVLMDAEDAETMLLNLVQNRDLASQLTKEELQSLDVKAQAFPSDIEGVSDREDLLDTLHYLLNEKQIENGPVTLEEPTATVEASIYLNSADLENNAQPLVVLDDTSNTVLNNWEHGTEVRILYVNASLAEEGNYELVLSLQPILYADDFGTSIEPDYEKNELIKVNTTASYQPKEYSGDLIWDMNSITQLAFSVGLRYDVNLWNKDAGNLNYSDEPLLRVFIRNKDTNQIVDEVDLNQIVVPKKIADGATSRFAVNSNSYSIYDGIVNANKADIVKMMFRRNLSSNYQYYYPKLVFEIEIPEYEDENGNSHYLDADFSKIKFDGVKSGKAEYTIDESLKSQGKVTITLRNFYSTSTTHFSNIEFTYPEGIVTDASTITFEGSIQATQYNTDDPSETGIPITKSKYTFSFIYNIKNIVNLTSEPKSGKVNAVWNTDNVQFFGTLLIENTGNLDSSAYQVVIQFDSNNTKRINTTSMRLPVDTIQEKITIQFNMVDQNGNYVTENGEIKQFEMTVNNPHYKANKVSNLSILFHRGLVKGYEDYFFKNVTYKIGTIAAGTKLYQYGWNNGMSSSNTFWGYYNSNSASTKKPTIAIDFYEYDSEGIMSPTKDSTLSKNITTSINTASQTTYGLKNGRINGVDAGEIFIQAGQSATISGRLEVANYPYNSNMSLSKIRFGLKLPQGVTVIDDKITVKTKDGVVPQSVTVIPPTSSTPIWIIELDENLTIGHTNELLEDEMSDYYLDFSIGIQTEKGMTSQPLDLQNILWAAGDGQNTYASGTWRNYHHADPYDLNGITKTPNNTDYIGGFYDEKAQLIIESTPALLNITGTVRDSNETIGDSDAALKHFADYVTYDLKIACEDGGSARNFFYLIPVPRKKLHPDFIQMQRIDMKLNSINKPVIHHNGGEEFKVLYSFADFSELSYDDVKNSTTIQWFEESSISTEQWDDVTMMKVVAIYDTITAGTSNVISIPYYYYDNNYQCEEDANTYRQEAGMTVQFSSRGHYYYKKGETFEYEGDNASTQTKIRLEYTIPETIEITLVAAKDRIISNTEHSYFAEFEIDQTFGLDQNYEIRKVKTQNLTLLSSNSSFDSVNNNNHFAIIVQAYNQVDHQYKTAVDLESDASVDHPIPVGSFSSEQKAKFRFELFNGGALSDSTTERKIYLDLIGHNGVTIPVEITILVEPTIVDSASMAILGYKAYSKFVADQYVEISENSAITAQFAVTNLTPENYPERILSFNSALSKGTTLLMVDLTDVNSPKYYHKKIMNDTTDITLDQFISLADGKAYVYPQGKTSIEEETFLFVVDFPKGVQGSNRIKMTWTSSGNILPITQELSYLVSDQRTFALSIEKDSVSVNEPFTLIYGNNVPDTIDNCYSNRKMSLVISDRSNDLPSDTKLVVSGKEWYKNAQNQFIVQLDDMITTGTKEIDAMFVTPSNLSGVIHLDVALYISATANDLQPLAGEKVAQDSLDVVSNQMPSFKVISMSKRVFVTNRDRLSTDLVFEQKNIGNYQVLMEVQKKTGSSFSSDEYYLKEWNGSSAVVKQTDLTELVKSSSVGSVHLAFNDLQTGTYRILFIIKEGNNIVYTVPYHFLVVPE